jgi:glucosamine--fructose-6-phosphate aminotransferase (isomerizing)
MCGIFGYLNYLVPRERKMIVQTLIDGLKRLEYRGYDSAGLAIDSDAQTPSTIIIKKQGKVAALEQQVTVCVSSCTGSP